MNQINMQVLEQCKEQLQLERAAIDHLLNDESGLQRGDEGRRRFSQRQARVDRALDRLANGIYGRCLNCGHWIEARRLLALPYAELCFECQRAEEAGHDSYVSWKVHYD